MCFVFSPDPKTDNSLFRSWWSLTNIMEVIASSIGTTSEPWVTHPLCIVQFLKIECSMLIMPLSRWFIANLRPLVTSFRVNMWLQFDNKPSDIQIICNFKHLFISQFISEYYIRQRVCPFNNIGKAFSGNYKSFNTWKIRQKTPTIMISRQNGDFLTFFSEQVSLFFGSYISFTNCTSCLYFSTNDDHNEN